MTAPKPSPGESAREQPVLVYDGDCGFCTYWARRWRQKVDRQVAIVALQDEARRPPGLSTAALKEAVHLVDADGSVRRGADAVLALMARRWNYRPLYWLYRFVPPLRWISDAVYRWVANHRGLVSRWTRWMRRD